MWTGGAANSGWGISTIFGGSDNRTSSKESSANKSFSENVHTLDHAFSMIHLKEVTSRAATYLTVSDLCRLLLNEIYLTLLKPPSTLRPSETHTENEAIEIAVTKLLLKSYYDIVRKNVEDSVPKAIMHFLVR